MYDSHRVDDMIMSLQLSANAFHFIHKPSRTHTTSASAALSTGVKTLTEANTSNLQLETTKDRIRKLFDDVQVSTSSYDTAWVALVPSPTSSKTPFFPDCLDWLLENQHSDGSWGISSDQNLLVKDAISSTLASILALKRWGVGKEQIARGLHFIESNNTSVLDGNQRSPIGFEIIFPEMVRYAEELNISIPFEPLVLDTMNRKRKLELRRAYFEGRKTHLAYISEGVGKSQDWGMAMTYQRKNGSLLNSPSATAAAYMHLKDARCLDYLKFLLNKFGNAVPTVYPFRMYVRLCMVDIIEKLGIKRHFRKEITSVLDELYRCWLQEEEGVFLDNATCALAFRLLRLNGYDVSSDRIMRMTEEELILGSCGGDLNIIAAMELYKASEVILYPNESALEEQNFCCGQFLKENLYNGVLNNSYLSKEVNDALKLPSYATLDRTAIRKTIEHYHADSTRILKTAYSSPNIRNEDFLRLALEDFNGLQAMHRKELKSLERWSEENRLDKLKFARQKVLYCFYASAATFFAPELSDARISWTKNAVLTTVVDDFFDDGGSMEELENLIQLIEKWDVDVADNCCSEEVEILFSAVHSTMCELGTKAFRNQGRNVTSHLKEMWLEMVISMLEEAKWAKHKTVPTIEEYIRNGYVSFALGPIVLSALYFVGPKISEEVVASSEYHRLFELIGNIGRLLNDIVSYERETEAGQLNAVTLLMFHGTKTLSKEEANEEIRRFVATQRTELLKRVLEREGSVIPPPCKELFWHMSKVLHFFYKKGDEYTTNHMTDTVKTLIYEPISLGE